MNCTWWRCQYWNLRKCHAAPWNCCTCIPTTMQCLHCHDLLTQRRIHHWHRCVYDAGDRCSHEGCDKSARGKSGLCVAHGGGANTVICSNAMQHHGIAAYASQPPCNAFITLICSCSAGSIIDTAVCMILQAIAAATRAVRSQHEENLDFALHMVEVPTLNIVACSNATQHHGIAAQAFQPPCNAFIAVICSCSAGFV